MLKRILKVAMPALCILPIPAYAKNGTVLVNIPAAVCSFKIGDAPEQKCKQIVYMQVPKTGRAEFSVPTDVGAIGFSGGKDIQVSTQDYLLKLDSILNGRGDATSARIPATGICKMRTSVSGDFVSSVTCTAKTEFGDAVLNLVGSNEKVGILNVPGK